MNDCLAPDCLMGGLGGDNMTVVLICFLHGKPYEHLVERCASSLNAPEHTFTSLTNRQMPTNEHEPLIDDEEDDDDDAAAAGDRSPTPPPVAKNTTAIADAAAAVQPKRPDVKLRRVVNKPGENGDDDDEDNNGTGVHLI